MYSKRRQKRRKFRVHNPSSDHQKAPFLSLALCLVATTMMMMIIISKLNASFHKKKETAMRAFLFSYVRLVLQL